jgi:hypothetical protein
MRPRIAAAVALAAGLIAAPAFAADPTSPPAGAPPAAAPPAAEPPATAPAPMAKPAPMRHHRTTMRHGMTHTMAKPDSEHMSIEQLNAMSLDAAKRGQSFSPPAGSPPPAK